MKRFKWQLPTLILGIVALLVVGYYKACESFDPCDNGALEREISKDGAHQLLVFVRNCGATTGFSYHVSLMDSDEELSDSDAGNLLRISIPRGALESQVHAEWTGASTALVTYPAKSEIYKRIAHLNSISVTYEEL